MLKNTIEKLIQQNELNGSEIRNGFDEMIESNNTAQVAAFMALLRAKGETVSELVHLVQYMQEKMRLIKPDHPTLDIVGTGGDGANTVNISTGAAILASACGVKIAKHGNASVSSQCGSADVLEKLGVNIYLEPSEVTHSINDIGFGFCFAPLFHPALKELKDTRRQLGIATSLNLLGPLLNPANAEYLMIGVTSNETMALLAKVLLEIKIKRAIIFTSDGVDEVTTACPASVTEINNNKLTNYTLLSGDFTFNACVLKDLQGGSPDLNASIIRETLKGKCGPVADTLIFNAGIANYLYGISDSIDNGIILAKEKLNNGEAYQKLNKIVEFSQRTKRVA